MRRHLHENPEPSYCERDTSAFIAATLDEIGIPYERSTATYGLVAVIEGRNPEKKTIALRADFDALEIVERTDLPFQSKRKKYMHACGHDVHTSSLLGAAMILHEVRDQFEGRIRLYFEAGKKRYPAAAPSSLKKAFWTIQGPHAFTDSILIHSSKGGNWVSGRAISCSAQTPFFVP